MSERDRDRPASGMDATVASPTSPTSTTNLADTRPDAAPPPTPSGIEETLVEPGQRRTRLPDLTVLPTVGDELYVRGEEIARGGMGRIIRAHDRRLGRDLAIKELVQAHPELELRFAREIRITARLEHPSIISVHEAGRWENGEPFFAMKHVVGRPLDRVIAERATLAERIALLPNVIAVAEALAYAHSHKVIHRDLKPANVLVGEFGETVVIDWGLAKDLSRTDEPDGPSTLPVTGDHDLTVVGQAMGTPAYMPPEQASGDAVDERADVYALGAMLYHLLVGQMPYADSKPSSAVELLAMVSESPPTSVTAMAPGTPVDLIAIVDKAMERDPAQRYPTARGLVDDLRRFEAGQLVSVHHYSTTTLLKRWMRRHRTSLAVAGVMLVALVIVGVVGVTRVLAERDRANAQRALAESNRNDVEDMLAFMLGDLHQKLRAIGRLDALAPVVERANAYYALHPEDGSAPADQLRTRALSHTHLGDLAGDTSALPRAKTQYEMARQILDGLVARDPSDVVSRRELAGTGDRLGDVAMQQGDTAGAIASYQHALREFEALATAVPDDPQIEIALAATHDRLGDAMFRSGKLDDTLAHFQASLAIYERLARAEPDSTPRQLRLSVAHAALGDVTRERGDDAGARREFEAARDIARRQRERDPKNAQLLSHLVLCQERLADLAERAGDLASARDSYLAALKVNEKVAADDPDSLERQRAVSLDQGNLCRILALEHDVAAAIRRCQAAIAIHDKLTAKDSTNTVWQRDLASIHDRMADAQRAGGTLAGAVEHARASVAIRERLVRVTPDGPMQLELAAAHAHLAPIARDAGDLATARASWGTCADLYLRYAASHYDHYNSGCCAALRGEPDRAFERLGTAIDKGFDDRTGMANDGDLVSLHDDPRWQPLLARIVSR